MRRDVLYVGSFTPPGGQGRGISVVRPDGGDGFALVGEVAAAAPSFLAWHPRLAVVYAVSEDTEGAVDTYRVGDGGLLEPLARHGSGGSHPCHVAVSSDGGRVAVANYADGVVAVYSLGADGLPVEPGDVLTHRGGGSHPRQDGPHAHFVRFHRDVLYVVDLGTDQVRRYVTGDDGRTVPHPGGHVGVRAGSGPRHLVTDGYGAWVVADELGGSVTSYIEGDGGLWSEVSRLPASTSGEENYPSHIELSADGQFVYVANRGPDTVGVFYLERGRLEPVGEVSTGGAWPRHFALDGDARRLYVANERSHDVTVFDVPRALPEPTGHRLEIPSPGCVLLPRRDG